MCIIKERQKHFGANAYLGTKNTQTQSILTLCTNLFSFATKGL